MDAANKGLLKAWKIMDLRQELMLDMINKMPRQINLIYKILLIALLIIKVDLICAIATPAAQSAANATKNIPIVGTAITDYGSEISKKQ